MAPVGCTGRDMKTTHEGIKIGDGRSVAASLARDRAHAIWRRTGNKSQRGRFTTLPPKRPDLTFRTSPAAGRRNRSPLPQDALKPKTTIRFPAEQTMTETTTGDRRSGTDRRSGSERRQRDGGPPPGRRDQRHHPEPRKPEVVEVSLSETEWEVAFGSLAAQRTRTGKKTP
jgi:hypothetical protein